MVCFLHVPFFQLDISGNGNQVTALSIRSISGLMMAPFLDDPTKKHISNGIARELKHLKTLEIGMNNAPHTRFQERMCGKVVSVMVVPLHPWVLLLNLSVPC